MLKKGENVVGKLGKFTNKQIPSKSLVMPRLSTQDSRSTAEDDNSTQERHWQTQPHMSDPTPKEISQQPSDTTTSHTQQMTL